MVEINVVNADILRKPCDLLVLKHADGFYGVDEKISKISRFYLEVPEGSHVFSEAQGLEARKVLYIGVGPLVDFRYEKIRYFAFNALKIALDEASNASTICMPVHGPGYGLDDIEAFLSLISGFRDAIDKRLMPIGLKRIDIVEINRARALRFKNALRSFQLSNKTQINPKEEFRGDANLKQHFGAESETKEKLFVAMPFSENYSDVWDIAIQDACTKAEILCERIAEAAFTGDIMVEIRTRIESCSGLIAVLDDANPNVFLEIGYAWALNKPTILLIKDASKLPFDVRGQRCLVYKSINNLRQILTDELKKLVEGKKFKRYPRSSPV